MQIPVFAKELGLDSITYQKLRIEKYSPLQELVEETPGFFIGDDRIVYSEALMRPGLKRISKQIKREFYTPAQMVRIVAKIFRIRVFTIRNLPPLLLSIPLVLGNIVGRKVNKKMRRFELWKRLFPRWA
jgi:hypothetical protein